VPALLIASLVMVSGLAPVAAGRAPIEPRARVEHHLHQAEELTKHFESVLNGDCPRFATPDRWNHYLDDQIDRIVSLVAHLEQAWAEAKHTTDDELRRIARLPRQRGDQGPLLIDKLANCATENGVAFDPQSAWRRIEREVPRRRAEITLPR